MSDQKTPLVIPDGSRRRDPELIAALNFWKRKRQTSLKRLQEVLRLQDEKSVNKYFTEGASGLVNIPWAKLQALADEWRIPLQTLCPELSGPKDFRDQNILKACEQLGIIAIHPNGHLDPPEFKPGIKRLRFFGVMGVMFAERCEDYLLDALQHGAQVRVLLAHHDSIFLKEILEMSNPRYDKEKRDGYLDGTYENLKGFVSETKKFFKTNKTEGFHIGSLEIAWYSAEFQCAMFAENEDWGRITLSLPPKNLGHTTSLELTGVRRGLLEEAVAYFDCVWERARKRHYERLL
jgi:hypothetical protein